MIPAWSRAWGEPVAQGLIRCQPGDFRVTEELGFAPSGDGEHCFLYLQKRELTTPDLVTQLSRVSGIHPRNIGFSGLKDRNAVTRQWFSVGLAGQPEPDWGALESAGDITVLAVERHRKKLRRGVHRANAFQLILRQVQGSREDIATRLRVLRDAGVPNYFGEQRFGRHGATYGQALRWVREPRRISRQKRGLYLSALRAYLFNCLLSHRVDAGQWRDVSDGDTCVLGGSRSFFRCDLADAEIRSRAARGDLHPGLPLWGRELQDDSIWQAALLANCPAECVGIAGFLEGAGMALDWRATRLLPDDFSWQFCDDDTLQLDFALGAGSYATALLAEFVHYKEGNKESGRGSEQD